MKSVSAAGGSGGHLYPGLALAEHLKNNMDCHITLIKSNKEIENMIVNNSVYIDEIINLDVIGLHRKLIYKNILTFYKLLFSFLKSKKVLRKISPDAVIGMGGYVSFPVLISASKYRTFIHEQNVIPGLVNRILSKFVDYVLVSFEESKENFKRDAFLTKNPRVLELSPTKSFSNRILIVGGSQGSKVINDAVIEQYNKLKNRDITLVTGPRYYADVIKEISDTNSFKIVSYLNNFIEELTHSKLIVCRAGATTISEIIELEKPSILIPSSYVVNDHQTYNAKVLSKNKAGILLEESKIGTLSELISELTVKDEESMKKNLTKIKNRDYLDIVTIIKEGIEFEDEHK